jgi:nicotinic acid mononucleotide adenylyltransferase
MSFLRLVFYTKGPSLKVRTALPGEEIENCCQWKDKLEYTVSDDGNFTMLWTSLLPDLAPPYAHALIELVAARYPVSIEYEKLRSQCPQIAYPVDTEEWVFYGGTFTPWHPGHQACLELLPSDKVCFILPDRNPLKANHDIDPVSKILEISNRAKFHPKQFLVPTFLLLSEKNPTFDWIEQLHRSFPGQRLSLLLGFDSFENLPQWRRYEDLLRILYRIYVVSRLEDEHKAHAAKENALQANPQLSVVFLGRHPHEKHSSTLLNKKKGTP